MDVEEAALITLMAQSELAELWDMLDLGKPDRAKQILREEYPRLVTKYGEYASVMAADWYDDLRSVARTKRRFIARQADPIDPKWVDKRIRYGAKHLYSKTPEEFLPALEGWMDRYVLDAGRGSIIDSVNADPEAGGWERVTSSTACTFCIMLADRGAVYTRGSADFASHDDCKCTARPVWDMEGRHEVGVRQYEASQKAYRKSPEQLAAHRARTRAYLKKMEAEGRGGVH